MMLRHGLGRVPLLRKISPELFNQALPSRRCHLLSELSAACQGFGWSLGGATPAGFPKIRTRAIPKERDANSSGAEAARGGA